MEDVSQLFSGIPVDKKLVHKHRNENVFICNLRRELPLRIDKEVFELKLVPFLGHVEKKLLKDTYILSGLLVKNEYTLNGLPLYLAAEEIRTKISTRAMQQIEFRFFLKHYKRNKKNSTYNLVNTPDENSFQALAKLLSANRPAISDVKKYEISEILDRMKLIENKNVFYANMIVDINHSFFFEHPNEHIPGMMLIEAVRQLLVAISHKYGSVPLKDYNFVLASMTGTFKNYLELNMPVLFKVVQTSLYTFDSGIWSDSDFRVHVYQNEKEAAVLTFQENILSSRVFNRLRSAKEAQGRRQWFVMKKHIEYKIALRIHGLKKFEGHIEYISHNECILLTGIQDSNFEIKNGTEVEIFMYFSKIGFVHGTASVVNGNNFGNFFQVHLFFQEMDTADKNNLHEAIKKYAYLVES